MLCREVMLPMVFKCREQTPVVECAQRMRDERVGFLPVVDSKGLAVGVVTDRDLTLRVLAERLRPSTPVRAVMTCAPLLTCLPDEPLSVVERRMAEAKESRALVVDREGSLARSDQPVRHRGRRRLARAHRQPDARPVDS